MKHAFFFFLLTSFGLFCKAQTRPAIVDYDDYEKLVKEVKQHRQQRLISLDEFIAMTGKKDVIILDARPKDKYAARHIKGAIHLNFADFTQDNLTRIIPNTSTTVLIYCNNNFEGDAVHFPTKAVIPVKGKTASTKPLTLALNIPTYINLYGYGYRNVYELKELVNINDKLLSLEGTATNRHRELATKVVPIISIH